MKLLSPAGGLAAGSRLEVLWIGNSLTDTAPDIGDYGIGPMPARLAPMLAERGIQLKFEARIRGGANFSDHARDPLTLALAADARFDAVNLQGYYEGYGSPEAYVTAVSPFISAIAKGGAVPLFQALWNYGTDPGGPQFPRSAEATEAAARQIPGAQAVPVIRAWRAVAMADAGLGAKLYADNTHQSAVGEHLNALIYARFFSGRSVRGLLSIHPKAAAALDARERHLLEQAADTEVQQFFKPARPGCWQQGRGKESPR